MALDLRSYAARLRLTDGVYGTELQKRRPAAGTCPELLNAADSAAVEAVARSYVEAGSDVILTNSLGANRFVLAAHGAAGRAEELAEALVLETFNELAEARIALRAAKDVTGLPVVVSMAFAYGPERTATMMGETPADLAAMAAEEGADAVGANCGVGPDVAGELAALLRAAGSLPVWIKPNAGLPVVSGGETTFPVGPEEFASHVPAIARAGTSFLGGCCGTTPEHIRALRTAVDALPSRAPSSLDPSAR
jgi:5-methyltetrahydrofolate--homocysteine methyltransferase